MYSMIARANRSVRSVITLNRSTEFKALCRLLQLTSTDSLLDVGSGDGYWTNRR
jgi:cyclopropane fatty-acyl-phospholipid synthase-like methyltransferase